MTPEQKAAFSKFKNKYFAAVQTDTELSHCDGDRFFRLEKLAKKYWAESDQAEKDFLKLWGGHP